MINADRATDPEYLRRMVEGGHAIHLSSQVKQVWPTPRCEDGECAGGHRGKDDTLYGAIMRPKEGRAWSTPNGDDANNVTRASGEFKSLSRDVQQAWASPKARDYRSGCTDQEAIDHLMERRVPGSNDLTNQVTASTEDRPTGVLNPDWVEILMGWPQGWTDATQPCTTAWPGWPMGLGPDQHPYEPPRIAPKGGTPGRVARLKACGNGVVPQCAEEAFLRLFSAGLEAA